MMTCTIATKEALAAIRALMRITRGNENIHVFSSVKIVVASFGGMTWEATNGDLALRVNIRSADFDGQRIVDKIECVDAKEFLAAVRAVSGQYFELKLRNHPGVGLRVLVNGNPVAAHCEAQDIPDLPDHPYDAHSCTLQAANFRGILSEVRVAISDNAARYYLNGVHFFTDGDETLTLEATDGYRMAQGCVSLAAPSTPPHLPRNRNRSFIVPADAVNLLCTMLNSSRHTDAGIEATFDTFKYCFEFESPGRWRMWGRCIDAYFPDCDQIKPMPDEFLDANGVTIGTYGIKKAIESLKPSFAQKIKELVSEAKLLPAETERQRDHRKQKVDEANKDGQIITLHARGEDLIISHENAIGGVARISSSGIDSEVRIPAFQITDWLHGQVVRYCPVKASKKHDRPTLFVSQRGVRHYIMSMKEPKVVKEIA